MGDGELLERALLFPAFFEGRAAVLASSHAGAVGSVACLRTQA
jgi:hypothetical protein